MATQAGMSTERQLVVLRLAQDVYGFDIHAVREIIRMQEITRVPHAPEQIEGVINLRGRICPVMDLRKRFGLAVTDATADSRIVVVEMAGEDVGVIVDGVTEVLRVPGDRIQPPSAVVTNADTRVVEGIVNLDDQLIILIDLQMLLTSADHAIIEDLQLAAA